VFFLANEAKKKSIDSIPKLKDEIERISKETTNLKRIPSDSTIKNDISKIESKLKEANKHLKNKKIKPTLDNINEASNQLDSTKLKVAIIGARNKITKLRKETQELKDQSPTDSTIEELDKVFALLNEAETLLDQENSENAIKKIFEAETMLITTKENNLKGVAVYRIKSVEKLYKDISSKNNNIKFKTILNNAHILITDAKQYFNKQEFKNSINKVDKAEIILNSFSVSKAKDLIKYKESETGDDEILQFYVVVYNKKNPDCLWRIAYKVYKNAKLWPLIYVANKNQIKDPDLIFPGQRFKNSS
jgi:hypothetical protein